MDDTAPCPLWFGPPEGLLRPQSRWHDGGSKKLLAVGTSAELAVSLGLCSGKGSAAEELVVVLLAQDEDYTVLSSSSEAEELTVLAEGLAAVYDESEVMSE